MPIFADYSFEVSHEKLTRVVNELGAKLDPDDVVAAVAAALLNRTRARFLNEEDPDGGKWPPSEAAVTGKGRKTGPGKTLFDTGVLFHSIQSARLRRGEVAIGTDVPYAPYHQFGTRVLPVRAFLGVSDEDEKVAGDIVLRRIREALE